MNQSATNDARTDEAPPTFDILPLSPEVRRAVDDLGYTHPTPVQRAVFESVAEQKDVVVQARTGTGKTAAFGLPVVDRIVDVAIDKPQVLVLSPTRELALQIHRELTGLGLHRKVSCTAVYGGAPMQPQIDAIRNGAQIIAGTPGRVLDHLERGTLKPQSLVALVLDESDEMLSMGFLPQITKIMERLPKGHQTLLFSATLPPDVKRIADSRLTNPEFITLSGDHVGALSIDHFIYRSSGNKADELLTVIEVENPESAIVFCNTRDQTKRLATALQRKGYAADWLNADLAQKDREKVMAATRESQLRFLVCTDVAARGIDISHLTHVINADFPESTENYVHRTGRTGRAGRTGTAISLITPQDVGNLYMLRLTYKIFPVERDLPRPEEIQTRREADLVALLRDSFSKTMFSDTDRSLARRILTSEVAETVMAGLLREHLEERPGTVERAAAARRATPPPISEAPKKKKKDKSKKKKRRDADESDAEFSTQDAPGAESISAESTSSKQADRGQQPTEDDRDGDAQEPAEARDREPTPAPLERSVAQPRDARGDKDNVDQEASSLRAEHVQGRRSSHRRGEPDNDGDQTSGSRGSSRPLSRSEEGEDASAILPDPLEVVSASALLSAQERALLADDVAEVSPERRPSPRRERGREERSDEQRQEREERRIYIGLGARDDVHEEDFLDTLADNGFALKDVLSIRIKDTHSLLTVPRERFAAAIDCLDGEDVGGLTARAEEARPPRRRNNRDRGEGRMR